MTTKIICDKCGKEMHIESVAVYLEFKIRLIGERYPEHLCTPCGRTLLQFLEKN